MQLKCRLKYKYTFSSQSLNVHNGRQCLYKNHFCPYRLVTCFYWQLINTILAWNANVFMCELSTYTLAVRLQPNANLNLSLILKRTCKVIRQHPCTLTVCVHINNPNQDMSSSGSHRRVSKVPQIDFLSFREWSVFLLVLWIIQHKVYPSISVSISFHTESYVWGSASHH